MGKLVLLCFALCFALWVAGERYESVVRVRKRMSEMTASEKRRARLLKRKQKMAAEGVSRLSKVTGQDEETIRMNLPTRPTTTTSPSAPPSTSLPAPPLTGGGVGSMPMFAQPRVPAPHAPATGSVRLPTRTAGGGTAQPRQASQGGVPGPEWMARVLLGSLLLTYGLPWKGLQLELLLHPLAMFMVAWAVSFVFASWSVARSLQGVMRLWVLAKGLVSWARIVLGDVALIVCIAVLVNFFCLASSDLDPLAEAAAAAGEDEDGFYDDLDYGQ